MKKAPRKVYVVDNGFVTAIERLVQVCYDMSSPKIQGTAFCLSH